MRSTNLLFFQTILSPTLGGVPRVTSIVTAELERRGFSCYHIFFHGDDNHYGNDKKIKVSLASKYQDLEREVIDFIEKNDIQIVICQNAFIPKYIKLFKAVKRIYPSTMLYTFLHASPDYWMSCFKEKPGITDHDFLKTRIKNTVKRLIYPFYNPYDVTSKELYRLSDKFVLLSESFIPQFYDLHSVQQEKDKMIYIPNPNTYPSQISPDKLKKKEKIVLVTSRLSEHQKKISVILKIWGNVGKSDDEWKLWIVGSGPEESYYKSFVSTNNIKNVTFFGHQTDVQHYFERSSIFVMTSIWEGLPMSLLEAQQNGLVPIVFDNFSAVHDVIEDAVNGFIITDNDQEAFESRLLQVMQQDELRTEISARAIAGADKFDVKLVADRWENELLQMSINQVH